MDSASTTRRARGGLQMTLPARSENVAVVRHAIAGMAEEVGVDGSGIADLKTVVTEACMNVVVHAYEGEPGPLQVEAVPEDDGLIVVVRDFGIGIRPRADVERDSLRLGLALIAALSTSFQISGGLDRGTEIVMRIAATTPDGRPAGREVGAEAPEAPTEGIEVEVGSPELLAPVLARVVGALAARREVSVDRLSDAVLLTDAIAARAPQGFPGESVSLAVSDGDGGIDMRIGPMDAGAGMRLREGLTLPGELGSLESLADELRVEEKDEGDYLVVGIASLAAS